MMKRILTVLISAFLLLCGLSGCGAANVSGPSSENTPQAAPSVAELSMETLVDHADLIVAGKVSGSSETVTSADPAYKTSIVSIDVSDVYKGGVLTGETVAVEINTSPGANGAVAENEPLPPTFSANDQVLLFLVVNDHGSYYIAGIDQGAYFKSAAEPADEIQYERQTRLGFGPDTFMLADLLECIEDSAAAGTTTGTKTQ